jgi:hypothetical protein
VPCGVLRLHLFSVSDKYFSRFSLHLPQAVVRSYIEVFFCAPSYCMNYKLYMSRAIKVFIFLPHVLHELHMRHLRSHGTLHNCSFISSFGCIIWQILGCVDGTKLGRGNGQKSRETIRDMSRVCLHSERGEGHWCGATCETCNSPRYHEWKEISQ